MEKNRQSISGRALPQSVDAEKGVLGSMLISPRSVIGECVERISEDHFTVPAHRTIFVVLVELWNAGQAIDLISFTQVLRDRNLMARIGGEGTAEGMLSYGNVAMVGHYIEMLTEKHICRQIIANCTEGTRRAYEEQDQAVELLADYQRGALAIAGLSESKATEPISATVMTAIESIERSYENKGAINGIPTGLTDLDRMTDGMHATDMIVIAARPSMGKTALAMNIVEHVAINLKLPVAVFSLEMSKEQLVQRMICSRARINLQKVRDGFLAERDFPAMTMAAGKIGQSPIYIDDEASLAIEVVAARSRKMKAEKDIRLIVVDYLQLMRSIGERSREQEVSRISQGIKAIAKDLKVPVVVLAQLNRQPESRSGGKPRLSDLRESGSIEQDADVVGFIHRPEVYEDDEERRWELAGVADLIIAKQRNGPVGDVALTFLKEFTRFEDRARNSN